MRSRRTLRQRLDTMGLRMQARLDADWADRTLPWILAAVLAVLLTAMSLAVVRQGDGGPGLGVWTQAAWHVRHGGAPTSSLGGGNIVTSQWAFISWPVLWATRWVPPTQAFAIVQAVALGLALVPIWRISRASFDLRLGTTMAVVGAYALAPALHAANLRLFQPEIMAVPALAGAALFRRRGWWVPYWGCVAVMLSCRADLGLTVAALGVVVLLDGDRLQGGATVVVGLGWTIAAIVILDPHLPVGPLTAGQAFLAGGVAPLAEARALFGSPGGVLADLFSQESLPVIVGLLAPLLFLSVTAPRSLIPAVPPVVLGIAGAQAVAAASEAGAGQGGFGSSRVVVAVIPVSVAALVALSRIGRRSVTRVNVDHRIVGAMVVASVLLFVQYAPTSPYQQPWDWGSRDGTDMARQEAVDSIPATISVTVSPQLSPAVAERRTAKETWVGPPEAPESWRPGTLVVILDTTGVDQAGEPLWDADDRREVEQDLGELGYLVESRTLGIIVLRRPA